MEETAQLRAQTILYKNDLQSVKKSVESISNALRVSVQNNGTVKKAEISFGDASPTPLMSEEYIKELNDEFKDNLNITYKFFGFNSGTSKGQNILFKECRSPYLMIYNPDVVVSPTYFLEMMKPYEDKTENVGMTEARQIPIEHPKQYDTKTGEVLWGAMACVIIPSEIYKELGGLDEENFFMYCDDVDFSWRLRLNGKKVLYRPNAVAFHGHRLSFNGAISHTEAELYYSAESSLMMAYKWSNNAWLNRLIGICSTGTPYQKKALEYFMDRKKNGTLPKQLDKNHNIACFVNGNYSKNRYDV
ncbi:MAG: glycosyltransferase [Clostridia bacterium]|nr:glycosyltransferase [Clostridia bacterium]